MSGYLTTHPKKPRGLLQEGEVMDSQSKKRRIPSKKESDAYFAGIDAAMQRAAKEARRRAIDTTGSVATWRNGKIEYDTEV